MYLIAGQNSSRKEGVVAFAPTGEKCAANSPHWNLKYVFL